MKKTWRLLAYAVAAVAGVWLTVKFFLPIGLPFLLGWGLARLARPLTNCLSKRLRLPHGLSSLLSVGLFAAVLGGLFFLLGRGLFFGAERLSAQLPSLLRTLSDALAQLHGKLLLLAAKLPEAFAPAAAQWLDSLFEGSSILTSHVSDWVFSFAGKLLSCVPDVLLFSLTALLSAFLFSTEAKALAQLAHRFLPEQWRSRVRKIGGKLKTALGGYVKAQLRLSLVPLAILSVGLTLLRGELSLGIALLIAIVDALPVFGSGTILLPWGVLSFARGETGVALGLLTLYALCAVSRAFLEPRFLGKQIGLNPLFTLVALYAGFRLFGILGMILLPVAVILLKQLYELIEAAE